MAKQATFKSGTPLPKGLYHSNKAKDKFNKYRLEIFDEEGRRKFKTIDCTGKSEDQITQLVIAYRIENGIEDKALHSKVQKGSKNILSHFEPFCLYREQQKKSVCFDDKGKVKPKWRDTQSLLRRMLEALQDTPIKELEQKQLFTHWSNLGFYQRQALKPVASEFFDYLDNMQIQRGLAPDPMRLLKFGEEPEKIRPIMSAEDYEQIIKVATDNGHQFMVVALELGRLTGLRLSDVLNMRFSDINDNVLSVVVRKTDRKSRKSKALLMHYPLKDNKELAKLIRKQRESAMSHMACPFVVHHYLSQNKDSKNKEHQCQVLPRYVSRNIRLKIMPKIKQWADMPAGQRPVYHEIRALLVAKGKEDNLELVNMGKRLGQKHVGSIKSYDTHDDYEEYTVNQPLWERK